MIAYSDFRFTTETTCDTSRPCCYKTAIRIWRQEKRTRSRCHQHLTRECRAKGDPQKGSSEFFALIPGLQLSIRAAVSAALAVTVAHILNFQYPLYALIGAVIVTDLSPTQTRQLGLQRLAGTVLGATVGATLSYLLPPGPVTIGLSILVAMVLSHVLHLGNAAKVTGYVCGIVVLRP